jgi:catechol 2,3-dioxygenase-like lactoylglutathione lyase family enzyme
MTLGDYNLTTFSQTIHPEKAKAFYRDVLGLTLVEDGPFAIIFRSGDTFVKIQKVKSFSPFPFTSLGWQVLDIRAAAQQLVAKGVVFQRFKGMNQDDIGIWPSPEGRQVCWFKDPDGNILSLTQEVVSSSSGLQIKHASGQQGVRSVLCTGSNGSLELLEDCLIIRHPASLINLLALGLVGDKTIPYANITAVQFKPAGDMLGYIQFTILGGMENHAGAGVAGALQDENSIAFETKDNEIFEKVRDFVEAKIRSRADGQAHSPSAIEALEKLANLLDRGLLTREEFEQQKSALLAR